MISAGVRWSTMVVGAVSSLRLVAASRRVCQSIISPSPVTKIGWTFSKTAHACRGRLHLFLAGATNLTVDRLERRWGLMGDRQRLAYACRGDPARCRTSRRGVGRGYICLVTTRGSGTIGMLISRTNKKTSDGASWRNRHVRLRGFCRRSRHDQRMRHP